jgi:sigma-B regulation protein RsbU (phosphoserine phosphatase)
MGALDYFTKPLTEEQMFITLPLKVRNAFTYYEQNSQIKKIYRRMKEEFELAEQIQKSLVLEYDECSIAKMWGKYIPCENIGGDIYCFKQVNEKLWFFIADVSGHGVSAAMVATMVNVFFKNGVTICSTPGEMLSYINS